MIRSSRESSVWSALRKKIQTYTGQWQTIKNTREVLSSFINLNVIGLLLFFCSALFCLSVFFSLDEIGILYRFGRHIDYEFALKGVTRSKWARKLFKQAIKMSITSFVNQSEIVTAVAAVVSIWFAVDGFFFISHLICIC